MNRKRMKRHCSKTHSFHNGKRAKLTEGVKNWRSPLLTMAKAVFRCLGVKILKQNLVISVLNKIYL